MSNNKGMAMLVVISLILMLLILGGTVMMISTGHFSTSHRQLARTKASYAAEAAMTHAFWALRTGNATAPGTITLPADFDINGLTKDDIRVIAGDIIDGVYPIDVEVDY